MDSLTPTAQGAVEFQSSPPILVFAGGRKGVGKTSIVANVAAALALRGKKVCVFDADSGISNINSLLGLRPRHQLRQVLSGECSVAEVSVDIGDGVTLIPAAHAIAGAELTEAESQRLWTAMADLEQHRDFLLIDAASTVAEQTLDLIEQAPFAFLVVTANPAALTDGFALLKALAARGYRGTLRVIVNLAADYPAATDTYRRFAAVAEKCLKLKVEYGGFVIRDDNVPRAAALQMSVVDLAANSPASRCLFALADNIIRHMGGCGGDPTLPAYWQAMLNKTERTPDMALDGFSAMPGPFPIIRQRQASDFAELGQRLLNLIKDRSLEKAELERFAEEFVEAHYQSFGRFPLVFKQLFYRWLEAENYPESRLVELVTTLEALHAMRYQKPMFSPAENVARLVAQVNGRQDLHHELIEQLSLAYRQAYQADAFDAEQVLLERMQSTEFTEEHFEELLQKLRGGFLSRFKRPYKSQHEQLLASAAHALNTMKIDEQNLRDEIEMLMAGFQLLSSRRENLMAAIKPAHDAGLDSVSLSPMAGDRHP